MKLAKEALKNHQEAVSHFDEMVRGVKAPLTLSACSTVPENTAALERVRGIFEKELAHHQAALASDRKSREIEAKSKMLVARGDDGEPISNKRKP